MEYRATIYYLNESYVPKAINFLGEKLGKNPKLTEKVDNVLIPIGDSDAVSVITTKGLNKGNTSLYSDYVVIDDGLVKYETADLVSTLKEKTQKSWWIISERCLE